MSGKLEFGKGGGGTSRDNIAYLRQMLAELAQVARHERADLLAYLLEMAFTEATDLLDTKSDLGRVERDHAARMAMKPSGKI